MRYLSVDEAAEKLERHPATVRKLIASGQLPAYRLGRAVKIRESDLDKAYTPFN